MILIPLYQIVELIIGLFFWWIAIYVISQNPFSRLNQLFLVLLTAVSVYLSTDLFYEVAASANQNHSVIYILKSVVWAVYLQTPIYYNISYLLTKSADRRPWQKFFLFIGYLLAAACIYLDTFASLTRDYRMIGLTGDTTSYIGPYLWLDGLFQMTIIVATMLSFYYLIKKQIKFSDFWYKYLWPFIGLSIMLILVPVVVLGYYHLFPYPDDIFTLIVTLAGLTLIYSVIRYDLIIADAKLIFGKRFIFASIGILITLAIYILALSSSTIKFDNVQSFVFPFLFLYLIIASHPLYSWLNTFIADLTYNISSGLSVVNDHEVSEAVRNYHHPNELEMSPLLRLNVVANRVKKNKADTPVDALRQILSEAIEYFKPADSEHRRIKENLRYYYLKMLAFDQAEEGQILWELGFGEYPAKIIRQESNSRPPFFKARAISDYPYASRNAFMALRKEALHGVAWRISYLEKLTNK